LAGLAGTVIVTFAALLYAIFYLNLFRRIRFLYRKMPYNAPLDISQITDEIFIAAWPANQHTDQLEELNIRLILCMFWEPQDRALKKPPFDNLQLPTIDFPLFPMPLGMLIKGVEAALPRIKRGERVMMYCKQGKHRSVAMACCLLIAQGYSADDAMLLVKQRRSTADPQARHIRQRIKKFEKYWRKKQA